MSKKYIIAILADFPVGLIHQDFPKPNGHYAVWLTNLYSFFASQTNFDIHWIVLDPSTKKKHRFEQKGQTFHILPRASLSVSLCSFHIQNRYIVAKELKRIQPNLVHAWGTEGSYALCGKDFNGKKLLSMQGILTAYRQRSKISRYHFYQSFYEIAAVRSFPYISTESQWGADRVREISNSETRIILWEYAPEPQFFHIDRNLTSRPTCLLAGTDTPIKNILTAITAFRDPSLRHVQLLLAGAKSINYPCLPENIIALGRQSRTEMTNLLSSTWCLLHPSLADTSPNIVKEARVAGIPCIVSTECGGTQYVKHEQSGFIVSPRDIQGIIKSVLKITKDRETSLAMGAVDQERCRKLLSPETMNQSLIRIYNSILGIA